MGPGARPLLFICGLTRTTRSTYDRRPWPRRQLAPFAGHGSQCRQRSASAPSPPISGRTSGAGAAKTTRRAARHRANDRAMCTRWRDEDRFYHVSTHPGTGSAWGKGVNGGSAFGIRTIAAELPVRSPAAWAAISNYPADAPSMPPGDAARRRAQQQPDPRSSTPRASGSARGARASPTAEPSRGRRRSPTVRGERLTLGGE